MAGHFDLLRTKLAGVKTLGIEITAYVGNISIERQVYNGRQCGKRREDWVKHIGGQIAKFKRDGVQVKVSVKHSSAWQEIQGVETWCEQLQQELTRFV